MGATPGGGSLPETQALPLGLSAQHTASRTEGSQPSFWVKASPGESGPQDALGRGARGGAGSTWATLQACVLGGHPEPPTPLWLLGNYLAPRVVMKGRNSLL